MRKRSTRARLALPLALCVLGALLLEVGAVARRRGLPDEAELGGVRYRVVLRDDATYALYHRDRLAMTLAASADTLCDAPRVALVDVDGDGALDLLHQHCRGYGYVTARPELRYVALGQLAPQLLTSTWATEVLELRGARLLGAGAAALFAGLALLAVLALHRRRTAAVPAPLLSP